MSNRRPIVIDDAHGMESFRLVERGLPDMYRERRRSQLL
jgi:hypothetical protein